MRKARTPLGLTPRQLEALVAAEVQAALRAVEGVASSRRGLLLSSVRVAVGGAAGRAAESGAVRHRPLAVATARETRYAAVGGGGWAEVCVGPGGGLSMVWRLLDDGREQ